MTAPPAALTRAAPRQLIFDLPVRTSRDRGDFFVSPANAMAVAMIDGWAGGWPGGKLLLCGPPGAGKTHLAHVWAAQSGARILAAADLAGADVAALTDRPLAIEDLDRIAGDTRAEAAAFHLHNLILAEGQALLITGQGAPQHWRLGLPDLQSRLQGTTQTEIGAPDDHLLGAVLMKLFADRQLVPTADTLPFILRRMTRSFDAACALVAAMDARALEEGRAVNRALARDVLAGSTGHHDIVTDPR